MISIPMTCDIIARISYKGFCTTQKINLSKYTSIVSKLPKGARIDVLSYLANRQYGWSMVHDVTTDPARTVSMNYTTTNFKGIGFYAPARAKVAFVSLTPEYFVRPIEIGSYLLGLAALERVKDIRIEQKKSVFNDIGSYLRRRNLEIETKVFFNNKEFEWNRFIDKENIRDYLNEFHSNKMDVYLTHLMIRSGFLAPVVFSGIDLSPHQCDNRVRVPLENYWIFYLMHGKQYEIYSDLHNSDPFSIKDLVINRVTPTYLKEPRAIIHLESKLNVPVVINGIFPMRFRDG